MATKGFNPLLVMKNSFLGHPESCAELVSVLFQGLRNLQVRVMLNRGSACLGTNRHYPSSF